VLSRCVASRMSSSYQLLTYQGWAELAGAGPGPGRSRAGAGAGPGPGRAAVPGRAGAGRAGVLGLVILIWFQSDTDLVSSDTDLVAK